MLYMLIESWISCPEGDPEKIEAKPTGTLKAVLTNDTVTAT
jgi:hypothetical protein